MRRVALRSVSRAAGLAAPWGPAGGARRSFMPLPHNQLDFTAYNEIDLPSETRVESIKRSGLGAPDQTWIATEKVHGTNLGIYWLREHELRFAKRSGLMDPTENFFGYHSMIDDFRVWVSTAHRLLKEKLGVASLQKVVLHGELFGCKYKHPQVPVSTKWCTMPNGKKFPMAGVRVQEEPFPQYSPELHFLCFDVKYSVSGETDDERILSFDDMNELCRQIPGLLYAKPLVRGTLDQCLAFDVENFLTPLPGLLGLGNYPLEGNWAEGVVIRHVLRGQPEVEAYQASTILKLRCSAFMELKHPNKQKELKETFIDTVRKAAVKTAGDQIGFADAMLPDVEAAANALLLNHVSEGRLTNTVSKIGRETLITGETKQDDLALMLAKDALKDFLKDIDTPVLNTAVSFRKALIKHCYYEAQQLVKQEWPRLTSPQD